MTETNNEKVQARSQWDFAIGMMNFFIPFYGLRAMLENYSGQDRLPIAYYGLLGLVGGIVMIVFTFTTKGKSMKTKIIVTALLLAVIVALNLLIN
jgi:peptidoglycan/LPS O-acetylase OafA/YrhL